jgi:predicted aspartyl protease
VDIAEVDLSQLLGGEAFTLPCTVSNNGLGIKTSSLIDTGANGHTFIDSKFVRTIERFLDVKPTQLASPCNVRGFDGKQAAPITHYIELTLLIDGRKVLVPILVVGLGEYNMILGRR